MSRTAALAVAAAAALVMAWVAMGPRGVATAPAPARAPTPPTSAAVTGERPAPAVAAHPGVPGSPGGAKPVAPPARAAAPAPAPPAPLPEADVPGPALAARHSTGAIRGLLHAADGRPLEGVPVMALAADGGDAAEDVTDAEGRYFLLALRPGRYAVFAGLGTEVATRVGGRGATVVAGAVTSLALDERGPGATVRVLALDPAGRPLPAQALLVPAAAEVPTALGSVLSSDAILLPGAARTVVEAVPPGRYTVVLLQGETQVRAPAQVDVAGSAELVVEVRLPAPVAVTAL